MYIIKNPTKGDLSSVFIGGKTYGPLMESVDFLYKYAKVDAVELEMITKKEYDNRVPLKKKKNLTIK